MAPPGIRFHTTRLTFRRTGLADDHALVENVETGAQLLADAGVDLILFNCTAASLVVGPENINRRIKAATGIPSTTTIEGVLAALRAAGVRRLALMTAYRREVIDAEIKFFREQGFEVVAEASHGRDTPVEQGEIAPARWLELSATLKGSNADGLLISCAGIQISTVLEQIERDWGRPVIASNQAALWQCLRMLNVADPVRGYGRLLKRDFDA